MIRLERKDGIARLLLDRAAKRNAIDQAMWEAIPPLVAEAMDDPRTRLLLLQSATPGIFSAGADIGEFARESPSAAWRGRNQAAIRAAQLAIARAPKPVVAMIDGDCVGGGCGLALAADIRIASPASRFGITPAKLGLVYSLHDTRLLVDLVGPGQAKRLLFTGLLVSAAEAARIGLVELLVEDARAAADALAVDILAASPASQRGTKAILERIRGGQADDDGETAVLFDRAFTGPDFAEGVGAFLAKRPAAFRP